MKVDVVSCTAQMTNLRIGQADCVDWLLSVVYASPIVTIRDLFCEYVEHMSTVLNICGELLVI